MVDGFSMPLKRLVADSKCERCGSLDTIMIIKNPGIGNVIFDIECPKCKHVKFTPIKEPSGHFPSVNDNGDGK